VLPAPASDLTLPPGNVEEPPLPQATATQDTQTKTAAREALGFAFMGPSYELPYEWFTGPGSATSIGRRLFAESTAEPALRA
jgi:hypothetical protein